jgi:hypothetical protein
MTAARYIEINRQLALMAAEHATDDDRAASSRLILRAAILQARAHNGNGPVREQLVAALAEVPA